MLKLFNLKIVFADDYEQLKEDWEEQNIEIDRLTAERNRKQKTLETLRGVLEDNEREKRDLLDIIAKLETDLEEKEKQRHKTAAKLGGYQKEINKLKEEISKLKEANDFLKNNRRAPNLEELKNYTLRIKKVQL
jgi:chromosome segregation ATPase